MFEGLIPVRSCLFVLWSTRLTPSDLWDPNTREWDRVQTEAFILSDFIRIDTLTIIPCIFLLLDAEASFADVRSSWMCGGILVKKRIWPWNWKCVASLVDLQEPVGQKLYFHSSSDLEECPSSHPPCKSRRSNGWVPQSGWPRRHAHYCHGRGSETSRVLLVKEQLLIRSRRRKSSSHSSKHTCVLRYMDGR